MAEQRLTIFGDSLTGGRYGIAYTNFLFPCTARGIDGQTFLPIVSRALGFCSRHLNSPVLIQGGVNDVVLNHCTSDCFVLWEEKLRQLKEICPDLFVCTIGPAGENPNSRLNLVRRDLNEKLSCLSSSLGFCLVDVAKALEPFLSGKDLFENGLDMLEADRQALSTSFDPISRSMSMASERGFSVTVDGIHLNAFGAKEFAHTVDFCYYKKRP